MRRGRFGVPFVMVRQLGFGGGRLWWLCGYGGQNRDASLHLKAGIKRSRITDLRKDQISGAKQGSCQDRSQLLPRALKRMVPVDNVHAAFSYATRDTG